MVFAFHALSGFDVFEPYTLLTDGLLDAGGVRAMKPFSTTPLVRAREGHYLRS